MNTFTANLLYRGITSFHRMPVYSLLREFVSLERMTPEQLQAWQWNKLQEILKNAVKNSSYYRNLFDEIGAEPEDIKDETSFRKIPILTKAIIKNQQKGILSQYARKQFLTKAKTSGSTGIPLVIYKNPIARASTYSSMYQGHSWHGVRVGAREARMWGIPISPAAKWRARIGDILLNRFRQPDITVSDYNFQRFYDKLYRERPAYLMGYPSLIYSFSCFMERVGLNGRKLGLIFVKTTAEELPNFQKEFIESVFGCSCVSEYGAAETGVVAFECPKRSNHIMSGSVYVEFENDPIMADNNLSKIIVTNLHNYVFPLIRYEVGDLASSDVTTCSCGRVFPCMSRIVGRTSDVVIDKKNKTFHSSIFSYFIKECLANGFSARQLRFVQYESGRVLMEVYGQDALNSHTLDIVNNIFFDFFGEDLILDVEHVSKLHREPSGKFRYFVSCIGKKAEGC